MLRGRGRLRWLTRRSAAVDFALCSVELTCSRSVGAIATCVHACLLLGLATVRAWLPCHLRRLSVTTRCTRMRCWSASRWTVASPAGSRLECGCQRNRRRQLLPEVGQACLLHHVAVRLHSVLSRIGLLNCRLVGRPCHPQAVFPRTRRGHKGARRCYNLQAGPHSNQFTARPSHLPVDSRCRPHPAAVCASRCCSGGRRQSALPDPCRCRPPVPHLFLRRPDLRLLAARRRSGHQDCVERLYALVRRRRRCLEMARECCLSLTVGRPGSPLAVWHRLRFPSEHFPHELGRRLWAIDRGYHRQSTR